MTTRNVCVALALVSAAACGGSGSTGTPSGVNTPPPTGGISVTNNAFTPATKTIAPGATVQWAWNSCTGDPYGGNQTCVFHDILFDDGSTSGQMDHGTFSRTFTAAATYNYHCSIHGAAMSGTIIVQ